MANAVVENLVDRATIADLKARVDRLLAHERAHPFDPGDGPALPTDDGYCSEYGPFVADKDEAERVKKRIRADRCARVRYALARAAARSLHQLLPFADDLRPRPLAAHLQPDQQGRGLRAADRASGVLDIMDAELGRDAVLLDVSINNVGAQTDSGGWHIDLAHLHGCRAAAELHPRHPDRLDAG